MRIIVAMHDSDMLQQVSGGSYLSRSAALLRKSIKPPLSSTKNNIDKDIRLLLDATGPCFKHREAVQNKLCARRVGNLWYTADFAQRLFEEILLQHSKALFGVFLIRFFNVDMRLY